MAIAKMSLAGSGSSRNNCFLILLFPYKVVKNCILQMSEVKSVKLSIFPKDLLLLSDLPEIHSSIFGSRSVSSRSGLTYKLTRHRVSNN